MKHMLMETFSGTVLTLCYQGGCIYYHHTKNCTKKPSFFGTLAFYFKEAAKVKKTLVNDDKYTSANTREIEFASEVIANEMFNIYRYLQSDTEVNNKVKEYFKNRFPKKFINLERDLNRGSRCKT